MKPIRHTIPFFLSLSLVLPKTGAFQQNSRLILPKHQININTALLRIRTSHSRMHRWETMFVCVCVCTYLHSLADPWWTQSRHHTHKGMNPLCSNTLHSGRTVVYHPHTHQHLLGWRDEISDSVRLSFWWTAYCFLLKNSTENSMNYTTINTKTLVLYSMFHV